MASREFSWMIGGPQGSGINLAAETLAKAFSRGGYFVFANIEYHSNIMGKHSFYRVRVADREIRSHLDTTDLLVALDEETLFGDYHHNPEFPTHPGHVHELAAGGGIIFDSQFEKQVKEKLEDRDLRLYPLPYLDLLKEALGKLGRESEFKKFDIMKNTLALGATVAILDYDLDFVSEIIRQTFTGRKAKVAELNLTALETAHDYARKTFGDDFPHRLPARKRRDQILMRGAQAVAIGKLKAGLGFQTYYPISPATDEAVYLEEQQRKYNFVVVQTEDEVSAINMAVGAAHMGVRASTSTAGPGFSLMPEGVGFAAMTESPGPVIFLYQRGGPSTGLPTRSEQADLRFALHPSHGDFPHIVVACGDVVESFYDAFESFNWADRYQLPVIVLLDKFLATSYRTVPRPDASKLKIDRGLIYKPSDPRRDGYLRYAPTETGITPRALPGQEGGIFWATTDEHNPKGHISEGIEHRLAQMEKRMKKLQLAAQEIPSPYKYTLHGPQGADLTIVSWGSTKGPILDALSEMNADKKVNFLQLRLLRPFPVEEIAKILGKAKQLVSIEANFSGQMAGLLREMTGIRIPHLIVKYDGRPFSQNEIAEGVEKVLAGKEEKVVVSHPGG
ncbi:MAG: 2-oxoacid:acceptor oxidoreductase subunit alpha [Chloroflexi bacterium]|nr:2-oxoacid:acceptor oxidoreductase subunit alpha [Chloroflexota bacterium]